MNKIKNISNSAININLPNVRFRTELRPKQERALPDDVMMEFNYDPGCINMVKWGFIQTIYDDNAESIGLEKIVAETTTAATVDVKDLLTNKTPKELAEVLKTASPALKDEIVNTAVELSIADPGRCNLIEKYTNVNILNVMAMGRQE